MINHHHNQHYHHITTTTIIIIIIVIITIAIIIITVLVIHSNLLRSNSPVFTDVIVNTDYFIIICEILFGRYGLKNSYSFTETFENL